VLEPQVFIIHNLDHALSVAGAAAATGIAVALFSVRDGASSLGPEVFAAIVEQAQTQHPQAHMEGILDCGEAAGPALAALRRGIKAISVALPAQKHRQIMDIAKKYQASVRTYPQTGVDLAQLKNPDQALITAMMENNT